MRIKYIATTNDDFERGKEYQVLSILVLKGRSSNYRIICDDYPHPILVDMDSFVVSCENISSSWIIKQVNDILIITPELWAENDFWDIYFDDYQSINHQIVKEEINKMVKEDDIFLSN